jgi:hypothetical protein
MTEGYSADGLNQPRALTSGGRRITRPRSRT